MEGLKNKQEQPAVNYQNGVGGSLGCDMMKTPPYTSLNFGQAIAALKEGRKVKRAGWGGHWFLSIAPRVTETLPDMYQRGYNFQTLIVAVLKDNGGCAPAQPYQADMLAEDWEIVF